MIPALLGAAPDKRRVSLNSVPRSASVLPLSALRCAIGLGFLSQYEGLFIRILLPTFAAVALLANVISSRRHRQPVRAAVGILGPVLALAAVFLMRAYGWRSGGVLYVGLALMIAASIWDLLSPMSRRCEVQPKRG